MFQMKTKVGGV